MLRRWQQHSNTRHNNRHTDFRAVSSPPSCRAAATSGEGAILGKGCKNSVTRQMVAVARGMDCERYTQHSQSRQRTGGRRVAGDKHPGCRTQTHLGGSVGEDQVPNHTCKKLQGWKVVPRVEQHAHLLLQRVSTGHKSRRPIHDMLRSLEPIVFEFLTQDINLRLAGPWDRKQWLLSVTSRPLTLATHVHSKTHTQLEIKTTHTHTHNCTVKEVQKNNCTPRMYNPETPVHEKTHAQKQLTNRRTQQFPTKKRVDSNTYWQPKHIPIHHVFKRRILIHFQRVVTQSCTQKATHQRKRVRQRCPKSYSHKDIRVHRKSGHKEHSADRKQRH